MEQDFEQNWLWKEQKSKIRENKKGIIIIIIIIPFMQGIHTYARETNHVSRVHSAAAILHVLLMVHIALSAILNSSVLLH
jgi:hypothetical protein